MHAEFTSQACAVQVEKAPLESYADVGGLEQQVTEIKEAVELPLTHPELYQDIGIKPPKVQSFVHYNLMFASNVTRTAMLSDCSRTPFHSLLPLKTCFLGKAPNMALHLLQLYINLASADDMQGVILYGEPGTGKTLLAKAVANSTSATFLRVVGSELIQKYLGDGPKLVRELFRVAEELAPTIVFIGTLL